MATTRNKPAAAAAAGGEPSSAATAPFAGLAEAAARWMPVPVAEAWTESLAEASQGAVARPRRRQRGLGLLGRCVPTQRPVLGRAEEAGNQAVEHYKAGKPPVLVFDYEMVVDGRQLERKVNYALVRIKPEAGERIDPKKRPFVIVDPRAGHGPGIGGFKEQSEVGVALLGTRAVSPANIHRNLCGS